MGTCQELPCRILSILETRSSQILVRENGKIFHGVQVCCKLVFFFPNLLDLSFGRLLLSLGLLPRPVHNPLKPIHDLSHLQALYAERIVLFSTRLSFCVTSGLRPGSWGVRQHVHDGRQGQRHRNPPVVPENQLPPHQPQADFPGRCSPKLVHFSSQGSTRESLRAALWEQVNLREVGCFCRPTFQTGNPKPLHPGGVPRTSACPGSTPALWSQAAAGRLSGSGAEAGDQAVGPLIRLRVGAQVRQEAAVPSSPVAPSAPAGAVPQACHPPRLKAPACSEVPEELTVYTFLVYSRWRALNCISSCNLIKILESKFASLLLHQSVIELLPMRQQLHEFLEGRRKKQFLMETEETLAMDTCLV
ncbi:uncharacterized protein LOC109498986 [Felis catus]|uniref:uncharacterized protein LOC109498986 n=1 Tax=Felis catus TaxID=9685 RepID=UPI001D1A327D|nr:uncharacterized protein LOC109498986 [Felis catus]